MSLTASADRTAVLEAMQQVMGPLRSRDGLTASALITLRDRACFERHASSLAWGDTCGRARRFRKGRWKRWTCSSA